MRNLPSLMILLLVHWALWAQSPHGENLQISCSDCHTTQGWKMLTDEISFIHDSTGFPLVGQHQSVSCKMCHQTLVFDQVQDECAGCHKDMHEQTLGNECNRCHTPFSWIVTNITEIHQLSRFPLLGAHTMADCYSCHPSASTLRFEPLGIECYDCHNTDFASAKNPDHIAGNFSTNCTDCHSMMAFDWTGAGFDHGFFPLTQGHDIQNCSQCHTTGDYSSASPECVSCHQEDYQATSNPNHQQINLSTNCKDCHTTIPGWKPAEYREHDAQYFPVYSGEHSGEWNSCTECHTNPSDYAFFTCIDCHEHNKPEMDDEHNEIAGYFYDSPSCLACHPTGSAEGGFDHNTSAFPLTGAHIETQCADCHSNGYVGTPVDCFACHETHFNEAVNPNHIELGLSNACETCHSTSPDWQPAGFPNHNEYYVLQGAHAPIASDCFACHEGNYVNSPNTCYACHQEEYNQTTDPSHTAAQFPTECQTCHTETAWEPSTFNHDGLYFPVYSGEHAGTWNSCTECHTNPTNYSLFSCIDCHDHNQADMDEEHQGIGGYQYNSLACFGCHPTGEGQGGFNHNTTNFPLTGAHLSVTCIECHENGYSGTSTICADCHQTDYQQSTDPNHQALGIPDNCENCHTTNPGWQPATFPIHSNYYPLTGAHNTIASDCFACHQGTYTNTPNTCASCHINNYNQAVNPNHQQLALPEECETCHTTNPNWQPATFPIHNNFYPLLGAHAAISNDCSVCHNGNYNSTPNQCFGCHADDYNQTNDPNHAQAQFPTECELCHTQNAWEPSTFNHDGLYFPIYSGEHQGEWDACSDCHTDPGNYSVFSCFLCHLQPEMDDEHQGIPGYQYNSQACYSCHPDGGGGGGFNHNTTNFPLTGAHLSVTCSECHENGYSGTSTLCSDCHETAYQQSTDPNHQALGIPDNCDNCHTTNPGWQPATFPIHSNYYPLTGAHNTIASDCFACHQGTYTNTPNTCASCHINNYNQAVNPNHQQLALPEECETCHTTNPNWQPATFPIHNNFYPLVGAHAAISNDCSVCHNGNYNTTPNQCFGCHADDYNQTNDPNHAQAQFPTDCELCHNQNAWEPSTFDHDGLYFPIYSGEHQGEWDACSDCHTDPGNYSIFSCLGCHGQAETDREHQGVSGYVYNSIACLNCHPDGSSKNELIRRD